MEQYLKFNIPNHEYENNPSEFIQPDNNIESFLKLEKIIKEKNLIRLLNQLSVSLLTKIIKFHFNNDEWEKNHVFIAVDSILKFIFNKIYNSNITQKEKFRFITKCIIDYKFLQIYQRDTSNAYSIELSPDILEKYYFFPSDENSFKLVSNKEKEYWKIDCYSEQTIKFECESSYIVDGTFKSYDNHQLKIKFLMIKKPQIYHFHYFNNDFKIWIVRLKNDKFVVLATWADPTRHPLDDIFEFLLVNDIYTIINNAIRMEEIQFLYLPLFNSNQNLHSNVFEAVNDMIEFAYLFRDATNDYLFKNSAQPCTNFSFTSQSKLVIDTDNSNRDFHFKNSPINILTIDKPFLYLIFDRNSIPTGGGLFNATSL